MIKRFSKTQVITDKFGSKRSYGGHRGVDLRSRRFKQGKGFVERWALQPVICPEDCEVLRFGIDRKGNHYIVVCPEESEYEELKFIHIRWTIDPAIGLLLRKGQKIGYTELAGSSRAHHLHFEVWTEGEPDDPVNYFEEMGIKYKHKRDMK